MPLLTHSPPPPLNQYVELIWRYQASPSPPHSRERLLPMGTSELVINLRDERMRVYSIEGREQASSVALIAGPHSECFVIDTDPQADFLGVHFRAGGVFPFAPAAELHNAHAGIEDLWGRRRIEELRDRLLSAHGVESQFRIVEEWLLRWLPVGRHAAVAYAIGELRALRPVADVCSATGLSHRRFIELFRREVGMTPKLFSRVERFQSVVRQVHRAREIDWAGVALDCGYYDQPHFVQDFKSFAGLTPGEYERLRTDHQNHVPLE